MSCPYYNLDSLPCSDCEYFDECQKAQHIKGVSFTVNIRVRGEVTHSREVRMYLKNKSIQLVGNKGTNIELENITWMLEG